MCDMNEEVPDEWEMWEDKMDAFCSSHAHVRRVPYQGSFGVRKLVHVQVGLPFLSTIMSHFSCSISQHCYIPLAHGQRELTHLVWFRGKLP